MDAGPVVDPVVLLINFRKALHHVLHDTTIEDTPIKLMKVFSLGKSFEEGAGHTLEQGKYPDYLQLTPEKQKDLEYSALTALKIARRFGALHKQWIDNGPVCERYLLDHVRATLVLTGTIPPTDQRYAPFSWQEAPDSEATQK